MRLLVMLRVHEDLLTKLVAVIERVVVIAFVEIIVSIVRRAIQIVVLILQVQIVFYLSSLIVLNHVGLAAAHHRITLLHLLIILLLPQFIHSSVNRIRLIFGHLGSV